jgi:hypothetical protein
MEIISRHNGTSLFFLASTITSKICGTDNVGAIAFTLHVANLEANAIEEIT